MASPDVIKKLEEGYTKLQSATDCKSLLKKYLTRPVLDECKEKKTKLGATLLDVIQSGVANLDSGVGVYAPDAEAYTLFKPLFDPIIQDYHIGFGPGQKQPATDLGEGKTNLLPDLDPTGKYINSTRVRCGRSLAGYPFNPCLTEANYKEMETKVKAVFSQLESDPELGGTYYPLLGMSKEVQAQLIADHFFVQRRRSLLATCKRVPLLADRTRHLPQQEQDVLGLGERRGSLAYHFHAERRQCWPGARASDQGCEVDREQGAILARRTSRLAHILSNQSGHNSSRIGPHQAAED